MAPLRTLLSEICAFAPTATSTIATDFAMILHWRLTPLAVIVGIAGGLFVWFWRTHRSWKRGWLSGLIDERLATVKRATSNRPVQSRRRGWRSTSDHLRFILLEFFDGIETYVRRDLPANIWQIHFPTLVSFALLAGGIAAFFLVSRWPLIDWVFPPPLTEWWQILRRDLNVASGSKTGELVIGAFAGLVVVVIALIVFVAESIRDDRDFERKRILLRISMLWPLGVAATLVPFGFLWTAARGFTIVLEAVVAIVTLLGFARVIRNLLDPEARAANRASLLRDRMRLLIADSIRERVGNNILMEQLGTRKPIESMHYTVSDVFMERGAKNYYFIDAPQDGWLADIQLEELGALANRLDQYARERFGFGLRPTGPRSREGVNEGRGAILAPERLPQRTAYLMKRFGEEVPPDSIFYGRRRALFALPKEFERETALVAEIRAAIPHIFRFTKADPSSVVFRRELQATKDQLAAAIRARALGAIEELRLTYLTVAEEFLTELVSHGGGYSADQAEKERNNVFQSWNEIRWLHGDLRELITIAIDGDNIDVMGSIAFLPFAIATRAVLAQDHYLFQQFMTFALFLYFRGIEKPEGSSARRWMIDKSWRYPKEIAEFYIQRKLEDGGSNVNDLEQMRGFALFTYRVFQDMLKAAADHRDLNTFRTVTSEVERLFAGFRAQEDRTDVDILSTQIERAGDDVERDALQVQLVLQEKRNDVAANLNLARGEIFLALGGRVLGQLLVAPENELLRSILDVVRSALPSDAIALTKVYATASSFRASDYWDWHGWDLVADGEAHFVDVHTKLNQIYAVRMLELLSAMPPAARDAIALPASADLSEMARENNEQGLLRILNDIDSNPAKWQPVLVDGARAITDILRAQLAAMSETERAREAEQTRNALLDSAIVAEFRTGLIRHLRESARLRPILAAKGALDLHPDQHPGAAVPSLGFNQVDDKNAYIAQERTTYAGWGQSYGQGLAHAEDEIAFKAMIAGAGIERTIGRGSIVNEIEAAIATLKDPIVLQTLDYPEENEVRRHPDFTPKYDDALRASPFIKLNGFMGELAHGERRIPVFDVFVRPAEVKNQLLVMDATKFLRWQQFAPDDEPAERDMIFDMLLIRVVDLNQDAVRRQQIIASDPAWLREASDKAALLRGRVLVNLYEKFRIDVLDSKAGLRFSLDKIAQGEDEVARE